jgi:hypothetical protein
MPQFFKQVPHLQMSCRIGGHHELEGEEISQDMVFDEPGFGPTPVLLSVFLDGTLGCFGEKGQSSSGRVENGDGLSGEAVGEPELILQDDIQRTNDIRNDGLRRVVNASTFAFLGAVGCKKGLVKMKDGIAPPALPEIFIEDSFNISGGQ